MKFSSIGMRSMKLLVPVIALAVIFGVYTPGVHGQFDPNQRYGGGASTTGPVYDGSNYVNDGFSCAPDGVACGGFLSAVIGSGESRYHFYTNSNPYYWDFYGYNCGPSICEEGNASQDGYGWATKVGGSDTTRYRTQYYLEVYDGTPTTTYDRVDLCIYVYNNIGTACEEFTSTNGQVEVNATAPD
jgi:hypothetical protein